MQLIGNSLGLLSQQVVPPGQRQPQLNVQLRLEFLVAARLAGLALQRVRLPADFFQNVENAGQVLAGPFEFRLGQSPLVLEPADAGRFLDDVAAVERLGRQDLADAALLDDGVGFRTQARTHEKVLDVAQSRLAAVDQVLAIARAKQTARDDDLLFAPGLNLLGHRGQRVPIGMPIAVRFAIAVGRRTVDVFDVQLIRCEFDRRGRFRNECGLGSRRDLGSLAGNRRALPTLRHFRTCPGDDRPPFGIDQRHRDLCHAQRLAVPRPGEDHVFHASAAQAFSRLLAEHPGDGVTQSRLAAPVRADHRRQSAARETHLGAVAKRLEPLDFNAL